MHKNADAGGSINAFFCLLSGVVSVLTFYISTTETQIPIKKIKYIYKQCFIPYTANIAVASAADSL